MSTGRAGRTQTCDRDDAVVRLDHARRFLEVAELVTDVEPTVAAALAVLSGIAASDAACCTALGLRSRGADHHEAEGLLERIAPGGREAANDLRRLIDLKDTAHYGLIQVGGQRLNAAMRQARRLIQFAEQTAL